MTLSMIPDASIPKIKAEVVIDKAHRQPNSLISIKKAMTQGSWKVEARPKVKIWRGLMKLARSLVPAMEKSIAGVRSF